MRTIDCEFLVAGSGIAGLLSAIHLAPHGRVLLITKKNSADSSSNYAQGGIACVMEPGDSFEQHVADTLDAGAGLCNEGAAYRRGCPGAHPRAGTFPCISTPTPRAAAATT